MRTAILLVFLLSGTAIGQGNPLDRIADRLDSMDNQATVDRLNRGSLRYSAIEANYYANMANQLSVANQQLARQNATLAQSATATTASLRTAQKELKEANEKARKLRAELDDLQKSHDFLHGWLIDISKMLHEKNDAGAAKKLNEMSQEYAKSVGEPPKKVVVTTK